LVGDVSKAKQTSQNVIEASEQFETSKNDQDFRRAPEAKALAAQSVKLDAPEQVIPVVINVPIEICLNK